MNRASSTSGRPIAILSDIHGNALALSAVLADLERRGVVDIYVAGDIVFGGAQPLEVWRRLAAMRAKLGRGLSDTALASLDATTMRATSDTERGKLDRFLETRTELGELVLRALGSLPLSHRVPLADGREVLVVHGSPADPSTEITFDMSEDEVWALIQDDPADIVACGGSHVPFVRDVGDMRVVGLGSVGEAPEGNVAHFVVITPSFEGTLVEQAHVEYGG